MLGVYVQAVCFCTDCVQQRGTEMMSCDCVFTYRLYDVVCLRTGCVLSYRLRATKVD
jgi:hypothetical protein